MDAAGAVPDSCCVACSQVDVGRHVLPASYLLRSTSHAHTRRIPWLVNPPRSLAMFPLFHVEEEKSWPPTIPPSRLLIVPCPVPFVPSPNASGTFPRTQPPPWIRVQMLCCPRIRTRTGRRASWRPPPSSSVWRPSPSLPVSTSDSSSSATQDGMYVQTPPPLCFLCVRPLWAHNADCLLRRIGSWSWP